MAGKQTQPFGLPLCSRHAAARGASQACATHYHLTATQRQRGLRK